MKLNLVFILSIFYFIFSCRTTPENEKVDENSILTKNPILVKINLSEIVFENDNTENNLIAENNSWGGGGNSLINNGLDTYTHYIDDYSFLDVTEITNTPQDNEYLSSLGLSADTNLREDLPKGTKYTILAYKKVGKDENENDYILHEQQEFTVGDLNPKIELDGGQNYTLIVVSTGSNISPRIENENDFNYAWILPNESDVNLLSQRIDNFVPSGDIDNVLDIKLKGSARISVIIDVCEFLPDGGVSSIMSVDDVQITYYKPSLVKLNSVDRGGVYELFLKKFTIPIKSTSFLNNRTQYKVDFQDVFTGRNDQWFTIHTNFKIKERNAHIKHSEELVVLWRNNYTFVLKPKVCGAYLGYNKTNFREITCLDRENVDQKELLCVWGMNKCNNGGIHGSVGYSTSINDWVEDENPCPEGYVIPTRYEWQSILDERNNTREKTYIESSINTGRGEGKRQRGWKIGDRFFLGEGNYYWTSNAIDMRNSYAIHVNKEDIRLEERNKGLYTPIRCMSSAYTKL